MNALLVIGEHSYSLFEEQGTSWIEVAVMPGGAGTLLLSDIDELRLEAAIEKAEDWLMPHAMRLRGAALEVRDETGRLSLGLHDVLAVQSRAWSVADVEDFFTALVTLAAGRVPSPAVQARPLFMADVLLLRELAHHAQLKGVQLS